MALSDASSQKEIELDIPRQVLERLLNNPSATLRFTSLTHLLTFPASNKVFPEANLLILKSVLPYFHTETDVGLRAEFFAMIERFIDRLRSSFLYLRREIERRGGKLDADGVNKGLQPGKQYVSTDETLHMLKTSFYDQLNFLYWYIDFLKYELQPTSSYQAHITALGVLTVFVECTVNGRDFFGRRPPDRHVEWPWRIEILGRGMNRVLVDLMMNSFDDVRERAVNILKHAPERSPYVCSIQEDIAVIRLESSGQSETESLHLKVGIVSRASWLMDQTGRADHSNGFARSLDLLFDRLSKYDAMQDDASDYNRLIETGEKLCGKIVEQLEMELQMALSRPDKAIIGTSISGLLNSLRSVYHETSIYGTSSFSQG